MTLMLHCGAEEVPYSALRDLETPPATASHVPIPHYRVVDMLRHTLGFYGHEITEEHHGLTADGMRYFGLLSLKSTYGNYEDTVCLRNSHDKKFPVGIGFGGRVFCCDNLSFIAEHVIRRRHTVNAKRDLPGLVGQLIEPLADQRHEQAIVFDRYKATALTDERADHAILGMYREGIINVQRVPEVIKEWDNPSFEEFNDKTAWRLFNAATFALNGRITENPDVTRRLHHVIDGVCTRLN